MSVHVLQDGEEPLVESDEDLTKFLADTRYIHFVAMAMRPGVGECLTLLEHSEYKPGTSRNHLFHLRVFEWEELVWYLASIPIEDMSLMEATASECGLRITKDTMALMNPGGISVFPIDNERVYMLLNQSNHPVYKNDPMVNSELLHQECEHIDAIRKYYTGR
jgi:hypothetical protein